MKDFIKIVFGFQTEGKTTIKDILKLSYSGVSVYLFLASLFSISIWTILALANAVISYKILEKSNIKISE